MNKSSHFLWTVNSTSMRFFIKQRNLGHRLQMDLVIITLKWMFSKRRGYVCGINLETKSNEISFYIHYLLQNNGSVPLHILSRNTWQFITSKYFTFLHLLLISNQLDRTFNDYYLDFKVSPFQGWISVPIHHHMTGLQSLMSQ